MNAVTGFKFTAQPNLAATLRAPKLVDMARYQVRIDYARLKQSIDAVVIKVSDGLSTDPRLAEHWRGCQAQKIPRLGYHFLRPGDGRAQAQHFVSTLKRVAGADRFLAAEEIASGKDGIYGLCVDIEWSPNKETNDKDTWTHVSLTSRLQTITSFLLEVKAQTGLSPIIYTALNWWKFMINTPSFEGVNFSDYHLWIADYDGTAGPFPVPWKTYSIWQTSGHGHISGIAEEVDLDVLREGLTLADLGNPPQPTVPQITRPVLRRGDSGRDVKDLQNALANLTSSLGQPYLAVNQVDSKFGLVTSAALILFQRDHDLEDDGICGPASWSALNSALAAKG